jgi:hypothetical protein
VLAKLAKRYTAARRSVRRYLAAAVKLLKRYTAPLQQQADTCAGTSLLLSGMSFRIASMTALPPPPLSPSLPPSFTPSLPRHLSPPSLPAGLGDLTAFKKDKDPKKVGKADAFDFGFL